LTGTHPNRRFSMHSNGEERPATAPSQCHDALLHEAPGKATTLTGAGCSGDFVFLLHEVRNAEAGEGEIDLTLGSWMIMMRSR
jgi:hypothetical protein